MMAMCEVVLERVALGEPLGELTAHAASCERCRRVTALPRKLAATGHAADPGLGFSARMTVGAQQRLVERRRRRIAGTLASTVAVAALAAFVMTRQSTDETPKQAVAPEVPIGPQQDETPVKLDDAELEHLVRLADTRRARRASANWRKIEKPLAPYMKLVKGETP